MTPSNGPPFSLGQTEKWAPPALRTLPWINTPQQSYVPRIWSLCMRRWGVKTIITIPPIAAVFGASAGSSGFCLPLLPIRRLRLRRATAYQNFSGTPIPGYARLTKSAPKFSRTSPHKSALTRTITRTPLSTIIGSSPGSIQPITTRA